MVQKFQNNFYYHKYQPNDLKSQYQLTLSNLFAYGFHKVSKIIFLLTFIILPIINNCLGSFNIYSNDHTQNLGFVSIIDIVLIVIGFGIILFLQGGIIFKTGLGAFFIFKIIMGPFMLVISLILGAIVGTNSAIIIHGATKDTDVNIGTLILLIFQLFSEILFIVLFFRWNITAREMVKKTFKSFKSISVMSASVIVLSSFLLLSWILNLLLSLISNSNEETSNQDQINTFLSVAWGTLLMLPMILIISPIAEEIAFREGIFSIFGQEVFFKNNSKINTLTKQKYYNIATKIFATAISCLAFADMHVPGEFQQIYLYFGSALGFSLLYLFVRRNFCYNIALHMLWNLTTLIVLKVS